jgi:4-diphosphocytidyl-2-C-methyl-D-erythritol kinase
MLNFPNAKINLGLNVTGCRADGFHNIETIFYPVPLSDILEIIKTDEDKEDDGSKARLFITGLDIPGNPESNLCVKAFHLLDKDFDLTPVHIHLHKLIPMGAGLGGGSSDGAFALILLNQLFELKLADNALLNYAAQLGSDCSFFIYNKPAFGTGKGNELSEISLDLNGYYLVLVKPDVFVGTAEAYSGVRPALPEISVNEIVKLPLKEWKGKMINDFEMSIFPKHPEIKMVKEKLYKHGALYASMTGSGSAVFGIFEKKTSLKEHFERMYYWEGEF